MKNKTDERIPRVVFQPAASRGLKRGIDRLAGAVRPTLGPRPGIVAVQQILRPNAVPELLDNGGLIARRVIALPDRDADMGAMLLRSLLFRLQERNGDGTATAAVLFQSVFSQGQHYLTSGGNRMALRRFLEEGLEVALEAFVPQARPVAGQAALAQVAESLSFDPPLAALLGEIFDIVGEHGHLEVRSGRGRDVEREYVTGSYWPGGPVASEMIAGQKGLRAEMEDAAVLVSDVEIEDPAELLPVLRAVIESGRRGLLLVCGSLSTNAMALLLGNRTRVLTVAVRPPGSTFDQKNAFLEDLALLTGGHALRKATGDTLASFRPEHLGYARRAWSDRDFFGIMGGQGDPAAVAAQLATLRAAWRTVTDREQRNDLRARIGKLHGGAAVLWVGAATEAAIEARKTLAERTAETVRAALGEGVVPGGGAALLACRPPLRERLRLSRDADERAAYEILLRALEEPTRAIIANSGADEYETVAALRACPPGYCYDVRTGRLADMAEAGVLDVAAAQREALSGAVTTAALALTVDVLVQHKKPEEASNPG